MSFSDRSQGSRREHSSQSPPGKPLSPTVPLGWGEAGLSLGQGQPPSLGDRRGYGGGCLPLPPRPENPPQEGSSRVSVSEVTVVTWVVACVPGVSLFPAVPQVSRGEQGEFRFL